MWVLSAAIPTAGLLVFWAMPRFAPRPMTLLSRIVAGAAVVSGLAWFVFLIAGIQVGMTIAGITSFICIWFMIADTALAVLRGQQAAPEQSAGEGLRGTAQLPRRTDDG